MLEKPKRKLEVGLIPISAWGRNLRAVVSEESWAMLRRKFGAVHDYEHYGYPPSPLICETCGIRTLENLHLHEIWDFDDNKRIQKLVGFMVVCEDCHNAIHFGRANKVGLGKRAEAHLAKVNGWSGKMLNDHIAQANQQWIRRSGIDYELDFGWLFEQEILPASKIHQKWLNRPARVFDRVGAISWAEEIFSMPNVVILDTETTGLVEGFMAYPEAEVIEMAIISITGDVIYNQRFKPLFSIPKRTTEIHGITNTMVRRSPSFKKEYPKILEILTGKVAVTYNARFDEKVIRNTCKLHQIDPPEDVMWECAMRVLKAYQEPATRFIKLPNASHNALLDCHAALDLIKKMSKDEDIICDQ